MTRRGRSPLRLAPAFLALFALAGTASAGGQEPPGGEPGDSIAEGCATPEHRQFDFWLGRWEVRNPEGELVGHNEITRVARGCGLLERWRGLRGSRGVSVNGYDPDRGRWTQRWIGAGATLWLEGGLEGEAMVLTGAAPRATPQGEVVDRITWTPLSDGRVRQVWEVSDDGGGSWREIFVGLYGRSSDPRESVGAQSPTDFLPGQDGAAAVRETLEHYLAGHATGDGAHMRRAFHPDAMLHWVDDGALRQRTAADYVAGFAGRPAPDEADRRRWIEEVDVSGTAASAKIVLDYPSGRFVDYMSLLRVDGEWKIVHKTFHRASASEVAASPTEARSSLTENTRAPVAGAAPPSASIADVDWLTGRWVGEGLGATVEEVWLPPAGDAMTGVFRLVRDGRVEFYEIVTVAEEEGSLVLSLKHFHPDLVGWEEREEVVRFPLVHRDGETLWFEGFTIRRLDSDRMHIWVALGEEGEEALFTYRRAAD